MADLWRPLSRIASGEWQTLIDGFESLANAERTNGPSRLFATSTEADPSKDVAEWMIQGACSLDLSEDFQTRCLEAGRALGSAPIKWNHQHYWLHCLYQYLCDCDQSSKHNKCSTSFRNDVHIEIPKVEGACEASTAFCRYLRRQALKRESSQKPLEECFRELIEENASSGELLYWSSPDSQRREVSVVARAANGSIPIAFLSTRLNVYALPIRVTTCESLRAFFDKVAERNGLMWCVTERGLWMAQQPPLGTVHVDSHGILHSSDSSEGDQRAADQTKRAPARGGLLAAGKRLARKRKLEERLRQEIDPVNILPTMSGALGIMLSGYSEEEDRELLREAIRELDREKRELEAKQRVPVNFPPVIAPLVRLPLPAILGLDQTPARKRNHAPQTKTQLRRRQVIFGAIQRGLKGLDYCRELDNRKLPILPSWKEDGELDGYEALYKNGKEQQIQHEKHRYQLKYNKLTPQQLEKIIEGMAERTRPTRP